MHVMIHMDPLPITPICKVLLWDSHQMLRKVQIGKKRLYAYDHIMKVHITNLGSHHHLMSLEGWMTW